VAYARPPGRGDLAWFRREFYACLTARADALFELTDAVLCADGPVTSLVELTLTAEHRRGHGAMYDALNAGWVEPARLRRTLTSLPLPTVSGRIVLAVDVSPWLRPDAATSGDRLFCHVYGRAKGNAQLIPGWPYSFVAALETGRSSWTAVLDAVRLGPADDATAATATQLRDVVERLITAGHWQPGDPDVVIVADSGYDIPRLAYVLADLPVELVGRLRSDRVLRLPKPPRPAGTTGRPPKPGPEIALDRPATWPTPQHTTSTDTTRYGTAVATSWDRVHPRLTHRGCWLDHDGELPVIEGTLIRLQVDHLPGDRDPKPVWLWTSTTDAPRADVDRWWQAFLRRFDLEHTFRLFKQTLGWTRPRLRDPAAGDRWTWLIIAAHTQLRLARPLVADLRRPWERPAGPAGSPRPGFAVGFGTSARPPCSRPAHRNPADPAPAARAAPVTDTPPPATTSARPSNATAPSPRDDSAQVKDQGVPRMRKGLYVGRVLEAVLCEG